jgi:hypothetical protein
VILVCFRFDDPSQTSDQALERAIFSVFEKHCVTLCVGVIPFLQSAQESRPFLPERATHLIEAHDKGVIEVALHGHSHTRRDKISNTPPTEFAGLSEQEQSHLISEGRCQLRDLFGMKVEGFIPPWNTYDYVTEKVLHAQGFSYVSAGWSMLPPSRFSIPNLPRTVHLPHVRETLRNAFRFENLNPLINVLFHHYDFKEAGNRDAGIDLDKLDSLLQWLRSRGSLKIVPLSEGAKLLEKTSGRSLRYNRWLQKLPDTVRWRFPSDLIFLAPTSKIATRLLGDQLGKIIQGGKD